MPPTVDGRDGDGFVALFVEDGELVIPKVPADLRPVLVRKGAEVLRQVPDGLRRFTKTYHEVLNRGVHHRGGNGDGDRRTASPITSRSRGAMLRETEPELGDGRGTDAVWYIRYLDDYRRTGDRLALRASGAPPRLGGGTTGRSDQLTGWSPPEIRR